VVNSISEQIFKQWQPPQNINRDRSIKQYSTADLCYPATFQLGWQDSILFYCCLFWWLKASY